MTTNAYEFPKLIAPTVNLRLFEREP